MATWSTSRASYPAAGWPCSRRRLPPRTNSLAVASLACGVAEFLTCGLTSIPAVIIGYMARAQIRRTGEAGQGLALAGLFLGWLAIVIFVLFIAVGTLAVVRTGHAVFYGNPVAGPARAPRPG